MSAAMVLVLLVLVMIGVMATYALSRIAASGDESSQVKARLEAAMSALEAYAASAQRLPCPAQPDVDTGVEVRAGAAPAPASADCSFPQGTVPWKTIGMKREDAYDPWGRKLSYRVYTGNRGSLTQDFGVSMVYCDTDQPLPGGDTTALDGSLGGLCNDFQGADVVARNTRPEKFLAGKGLNLSDMGVNYGDVAYVVMSHGSTGLGGYTVSGAQLDLPAGDERNNTNAAGGFTIKAFSDVDVGATLGQHFDDFLAYRRLPDLIRRIKLWGRVWAEAPSPGRLLFDAPTVSGALGSNVAPGSLGQTTIDFGGARASGMTGGGVATDLSFDVVDVYGGLGIAGGGSNLIQSSADEYLRLDSTATYQNFGVTLSDFGYYGSTYLEIVEFRFLLDGTPVLTKFGIGCNIDGGLASFLINVGTDFNAVEIRPSPAYEINSGTLSGITALLISEVRGCDATEPNCRTTLDAVANRCSVV